MVPTTAARPLVFYSVVPRGVSTADVGKALLKRFTLADVHGVQDFQAGRTEILFKHMRAVEGMLADPTLRVGDHSIRFSYRGSREKTVRVISYPMDASDEQLKSALSAFGRVIELRSETHRAVPGLRTGVRIARVEMAQPVPNFLGIGRHVVQCEYDGVLRVCRRCNEGGHMAIECTAVQCSRCRLFGHEGETCTSACTRCGGDHPFVQCPNKLFTDVVQSYRPVAPRHLNEAAARWQIEARKSNLDGAAWPTLDERSEASGRTDGSSGPVAASPNEVAAANQVVEASDSADGTSGSAAAPSDKVAQANQVVEDVEVEAVVPPTREAVAVPETPLAKTVEPLQVEASSPPTPTLDWGHRLRPTESRQRPSKKARAENRKGQSPPPEISTAALVTVHTLTSSSDSEDSQAVDTNVPPPADPVASEDSPRPFECDTCDDVPCTCSALSSASYSSTD